MDSGRILPFLKVLGQEIADVEEGKFVRLLRTLPRHIASC